MALVCGVCVWGGLQACKGPLKEQTANRIDVVLRIKLYSVTKHQG